MANIYVLDGVIFGYKFTRQQFTALCSVWSVSNIYEDLGDYIYEFKDYVIVGQSIYVNDENSEGGAVDLTHLNQQLLEEKEEIDILAEKMSNYNSYLYNALPQIYFVHLTAN